jgi:hypothetical protein
MNRVFDRGTARQLFDKCAEQLGIKKQLDWYKVTDKAVSKLMKEKIELNGTLQEVYPEYTWHPWLFSSKLPSAVWKEKATRRSFFDWFAEETGVVKQEEWYRVSKRRILQHGGHSFFKHHLSFIPILTECYSEFMWDVQRFSLSEQWKSPSTHRQCFDKLAEQLGIEKQEDWYSITKTQLQDKESLYKYQGCYITCIQRAYPEYVWYPWLFPVCPVGYWTQLANQRAYLEWLASVLSIEKREDWYAIKTAHFIQHGGIGLLAEYENSFIKALQTVYADYDWLPWLFHQVPAKFWDVESNVSAFLAWLAKELNITSIEQWHALTALQICDKGGARLVWRMGLKKLLASYTPPVSTASLQHSVHHTKQQQWLCAILNELSFSQPTQRVSA